MMSWLQMLIFLYEELLISILQIHTIREFIHQFLSIFHKSCNLLMMKLLKEIDELSDADSMASNSSFIIKDKEICKSSWI